MRLLQIVTIFILVNNLHRKQYFIFYDLCLFKGAVVESLSGTSFIAMRSIISKLVPTEELGKINSLLGVFEALMPLIYGSMYSVVYKTTIHYFPGTFFLLGSCLTTPAIFIYL